MHVNTARFTTKYMLQLSDILFEKYKGTRNIGMTVNKNKIVVATLTHTRLKYLPYCLLQVFHIVAT